MFLTPSDFLLRYFKCWLFLGLRVIIGMCVNFVKKIIYIYKSYQKTRFLERKISPCMSFISSICSLQFSSVAQSCPTLCDPMDCNTPGFPVLSKRPELTNRLILCFPLLLPPSVFPSIRVFSIDQFFSSGAQNIGVSASASVFPVNIQV